MNMTESGKAIEILLVEDNPGDARLMLETLKDYKMLNHVSVVRDGVEAMAFVNRTGAHINAPSPDLILLDQIGRAHV